MKTRHSLCLVGLALLDSLDLTFFSDIMAMCRWLIREIRVIGGKLQLFVMKYVLISNFKLWIEVLMFFFLISKGDFDLRLTLC